MGKSFKSLMHEFARQFDVEADAALESPVEITIDGMDLTLAEYARSGEEEILIYANLGEVSKDRELEVYRGLLEANLFWSGTADATIGVNSATRQAVMAFRLPVDRLDGEKLSVIAAHFLSVAGMWRAFVTDAGDLDALLGETPLSDRSLMHAIKA